MYSVDGQTFGAGDLGLETVLAWAYKNHIRPMCLCSDAPVPVYVSYLGGSFVLKRMPLTGSYHAVDCSHYEPPEALSGSTEIGTTILEDPDTGFTKLDVEFSLSREPSRPMSRGATSKASSVHTARPRLSLRGLLQFLWGEGELTKWKPAFIGKRSWAVVRHHLLRAAANKVLKGQPLAHVMFVPESFTVAHKEQIAARRARRLADGLRRPDKRQGKMIVVGEIKEIVPSRYRFNIVLKHLPDLPFSVDANVHRRTVRSFDSELTLWRNSVDVHLMIIATFTLTDRGHPAIDEMSVLPTSTQWIPADDSFELRLINCLVQEGRSFQKVLHVNGKVPSLSPSAILLDGDSGPLGLALDRDWDCEETIAATSSERSGSAHDWLWRIREVDLPAFPR